MADKDEEIERTAEGRTDFFINELARMDSEHERFKRNVADRFMLLEAGRQKTDEDPMTRIISVIVVLSILQMAAPIITDLVKRWQHSE